MKIKCLFFTLLIFSAISPTGICKKIAPLRVTKKLPLINKVKIVRVKPAQLGFESVIGKKTIKGKEAEEFAALWRSQTFLTYSPECHSPSFIVKLFSKGELIVNASLCWQCNTIDFYTPEISGSFYQGFQGDNKKGQAMLDFLTKAIPQ